PPGGVSPARRRGTRDATAGSGSERARSTRCLVLARREAPPDSDHLKRASYLDRRGSAARVDGRPRGFREERVEQVDARDPWCYHGGVSFIGLGRSRDRVAIVAALL